MNVGNGLVLRLAKIMGSSTMEKPYKPIGFHGNYFMGLSQKDCMSATSATIVLALTRIIFFLELVLTITMIWKKRIDGVAPVIEISKKRIVFVGIFSKEKRCIFGQMGQDNAGFASDTDILRVIGKKECLSAPGRTEPPHEKV